MQGGYDPQRDRGWTNLEWFLRDGTCWRRRRERIEQVAWTEAEMSGTLRKAGFDRISAFDAKPFFTGDPKFVLAVAPFIWRGNLADNEATVELPPITSFLSAQDFKQVPKIRGWPGSPRKILYVELTISLVKNSQLSHSKAPP